MKASLFKYIEETINLFLLKPDFCSSKRGKEIKDCAKLKQDLNKDLNKPGCTSCVKRAVFEKYRRVISKSIDIPDEFK